MTDSFIPVPGTNELLQTYENPVGPNGESVHSEAVTPTDQNGVPFTATNPFPTTEVVKIVHTYDGAIGIGGTANSAIFAVAAGASLAINIKPSNDSAVGGFRVAWFLDAGGTKPLKFSDAYTVGSAGKFQTEGWQGPFAQIQYTHGAVAGTLVMAGAIVPGMKWSSHRASEIFNEDTDTEAVASILKARNQSASPIVYQSVDGRMPNDNMDNPQFAVDVIGFNSLWDAVANKWRRWLGIDGIARAISEPRQFTFGNDNNVSVPNASTQYYAAEAGQRAAAITISVPTLTGANVVQLFGVHVHFGNGNATTNEFYIEPGRAFTWITNQRIAMIRAASATADVLVSIQKGTAT